MSQILPMANQLTSDLYGQCIPRGPGIPWTGTVCSFFLYIILIIILKGYREKSRRSRKTLPFFYIFLLFFSYMRITEKDILAPLDSILISLGISPTLILSPPLYQVQPLPGPPPKKPLEIHFRLGCLNNHLLTGSDRRHLPYCRYLDNEGFSKLIGYTLADRGLQGEGRQYLH